MSNRRIHQRSEANLAQRKQLVSALADALLCSTELIDKRTIRRTNPELSFLLNAAKEGNIVIKDGIIVRAYPQRSNA
jgi:hypothetical protein